MGDKLKGVHIYRFVNSSDIVTLVPLPPVYTHVGQEIYIDSTGAMSGSINIADLVFASFRHDGVSLPFSLETLKKALAEKGANLPPPYIVGNHSPARYPVLIWNAI